VSFVLGFGEHEVGACRIGRRLVGPCGVGFLLSLSLLLFRVFFYFFRGGLNRLFKGVQFEAPSVLVL
jgi:hypothetical protein